MATAKRFTVDQYIKNFPKDVQVKLQKIRRTIKSVAPKAEEKISYQIPFYRLNGKRLIYFAAWAKHISFYPVNEKIVKSVKELADYKFSKGTIRFSIDKPIPPTLIKKIVQYRVREVGKLSNK